MTCYTPQLWRVLGPSTARQTSLQVKERSNAKALALEIGTYAEAVLEIALSQEALSQEAIERNTQQLKEGDASTLSVESVTVSSKRECYIWEGRNHLPWECRFKDVECHYRGHKGHIVRAWGRVVRRESWLKASQHGKGQEREDRPSGRKPIIR